MHKPDSEAEQALTNALTDPSWHVPASAARRLGELHHSANFDALVRALQDEDIHVRGAAA
jgi:HEAT repeat protein